MEGWKEKSKASSPFFKGKPEVMRYCMRNEARTLLPLLLIIVGDTF